MTPLPDGLTGLGWIGSHGIGFTEFIDPKIFSRANAFRRERMVYRGVGRLIMMEN